MYHESTDRIKSFPISDTHLQGAAVLACSIADHQQTVTDCERCAESLNRGVTELRRLLWEFSDLLTRQDTALQMAVAAREHPSFRVPLWFYQLESENLRAMLTRRARYLKGAKLDVDRAWDLLSEFMEANHYPVDEEGLSEIVTAAYVRQGGH